MDIESNEDKIRALAADIASGIWSASLDIASKQTSREYDGKFSKAFYITFQDEDSWKADDALLKSNKIAAYRILNYLRCHMDYNNKIKISQDDIAGALAMSRMSVSRNLKLLKKLNFIDSVKDGTSITYHLNRDAWWKGRRNGMKNCICFGQLKEEDNDK